MENPKLKLVTQIVGYSTIALTCNFLWNFFKNRQWNKEMETIVVKTKSPLEEERLQSLALENRKPQCRWNTALFFPPMLRNNFSESAESTYRQVAYYFETALQSIKICALQFSEFELANIIQRQRNRGLIVQVITDYDTLNEINGMNNSCRHFQKCGIPVRAKNLRTLMHNKFVIFDEEAVLTGSLNFTKQAIRGGTFENAVVTTDKRIVVEYMNQFNLLWKQLA